MDFFVETLKNASLHIHAVWLAIAYVAVILAMAVDFIAGLRKAKAAGIASNSRGYKMTTEKAAKYFLPMLQAKKSNKINMLILFDFFA